MATKEIYKLTVGIDVKGTEEAKSKLTAFEKMTQQIEKKTKALDKMSSSPSVKIKDNTSNTLNKIKSKATELNSTKINPTARITDNASSKISEISSKLKKIEETNAEVTLKVNDQTSSYKNKVKAKNDRLKSTNVNPTAKVEDQASDKIDKIKSNADKLNNKKINLMAKLKDDISEPLVAMGSKISNITKDIAKKTMAIGLAATLAVGGIGAGTSIKTFATFEKGLSSVKAVTHATDSEMKTLKDTAINLGASTAWSAVEVTQAEELLGQAGFSVKETVTALPGLLSLASAGGLDLATATDIASGTLRAFNIDASKTGHVADVLALSASATNSDVTDLGESMKYVAPVAQSLGISLEDTAAATGLLSNANIKGGQAGTILRQTMARLASPTSEAAKVMQKYGLNAFDAQGNMKPLSSVVDNLNSSLGKLTSQQRADVISTIFGTESMSGVMALMNQGGQSLGDLSQKLKDAKGSADEMANTKLDNLSGQWEQLKGSVETAQIQLGEKLAPHTKEFVTWLTNKIPVISETIQKLAASAIDKLIPQVKEFGTWIISRIPAIIQGVSSVIDKVTSLATKFNGLNTSAKNSILSLGLLTLTLGPLSGAVSMIAKLGSGIGSLVKLVSVARGATAAAGAVESIGLAAKILPALFSPVGLAIAGVAGVAGTAIIANNNLMKKSCTTTVEELGPVEKIMNKLNGNINKSKSELIDAGLVYDNFGDGVSDSFKKGAQDASKSLLKIEMDIKKLNRNGIADESGLNTLKNYVNEVAYGSINAMKEQRSKIQSEFQKTFSLDGVTSDTEQKVLESLGTFFETGTNKQLEIRDEIYQFASDKIKEHGKLLDEDLKVIQDKISKGKALELEYTKAQNAYDKAYAKSQFSNDASKIAGIDGASELLQARAKDHQTSLDKIDNNYKGTLAYYNDLLSNNDLTSEQRENFTKGRDDAENTRNQAVQQENDGYKSDREVIYSHYEGARGMLNEKTGAQFSDKDIVAHKGTDYLKNHFENLNQITQEGWYRIKNTSNGQMEDIYATIDKDTGEISGAWSKTAGWSGGYTDEMKRKVKELGEAHETERMSIQNSLSALTGSRLDANNQIISSTGSVIGQLQGVQGATGEAITGIINLNGTPMQITSNASGQITDMQVYKGSMDAIPPSADVHISSNAEEATSEVSGLITKANEADGKTITITTIFKEITQWFDEKFDNATKRINDHSTAAAYKENYNGTDNATAGLNSVAERGMELVLGRRFYNFKGGEKVLNNKQTTDLLKSGNSRNEEPFQIKQGQYQLAQPQVQVAPASYSTGEIHVENNFNNDADMDEFIEQACVTFGRKLKDALTNIKK